MLVLEAELTLSAGAEPAALLADMYEKQQARRRSQPLEYPNAGSTFRRPDPDLPVGKLLDELGLKGLLVGQAQVSQKHAGFIVNLGGACAADVKELISEIQKIAQKERGIRLMPEICFIPSVT